MSKASDISDAAAAWLVQLEGQTTPEIWDSFQEWMDQDPRHRAVFIRLRVAWKHVDLLKNMPFREIAIAQRRFATMPSQAKPGGS